MVNKANESRFGSLQQSITPMSPSPPLTKGMTITSLEEVEMFSRIRIPAPGRGMEAKRGFAGSHTSDVRAGYIFPAFDDAIGNEYNFKRTLVIEIAKHCYFCFQDRCYLVLIRATQIAAETRRMNPFTILRHDGVEYQAVTGTVPEIMAELVQMLRDQAVNALTQDERYRQQVRPNVGISMCLGSMGRTRMLELLTGARFSVERRRGWLNRDVEERLIREGATPARTMCVPPPPPTPSGRIGSDVPQPSSAPTVRPPPAAPSRGRSPGGAASSSTDLPDRTATSPAIKAKARPNAKSATPPPPPRPTAAKSSQPSAPVPPQTPHQCC